MQKVKSTFLVLSFLLLSTAQSTQNLTHCNIDRTITPEAGPRVCHGADIFLTADFIYWKSRQEGMAYAYTGTTQTLVTQNVRKGSVKDVNWDWDPGFKVGIGLNLDHDGWDLYAEYTSLRSDPSNDRTSIPAITPTTALRRLWNITGLATLYQPPITSARVSWDLHFNVIDLELGRNYYISKYLTLRPHFGLKGTWQDQDYTVRYEFNDTSPNFPNQGVRMRNNQDYWGVGIRTGMDNAWYFIQNFCLFGDLALSALWGKFDINRRDTSIPDLSDPSLQFLVRNVDNEFYTLKAALELSLGLRFDYWWSDDDYHFSLQAGWEEQIWFSQNQHFRFFEEAAHGDLILHGLTLRARFDF